MITTGCKVKYLEPYNSGMGTSSRPLWTNCNNPLQHDKSSITRQDIARMRAAEKRAQARPSSGETSSGVLGLSYGLEWCPGREDRHNPLKRNASTPSIRDMSFSSRALGEANSTVHITGADMAAAGRSPHLPGYKGFVPGAKGDHAFVGRSFGRASVDSGRVDFGWGSPAPFAGSF
mmetsp:Transcript_122010/g.316976  ORF Transcript_122010/g.316976 Transcript_122010/m.316976 type:complete len:176 (+) Transcript_122010:134-661(+)